MPKTRTILSISAWIAAVVILAILVVIFLYRLRGATANEGAAAIGAVIGGLIGAMGAVATVSLILRGQRFEDSKRIRIAIAHEINGLSQGAAAQLALCNQLYVGNQALHIDSLRRLFPTQTVVIYPAIADRIALLRSPGDVAAFYALLTTFYQHIEQFSGQASLGQPIDEGVLNTLGRNLARVCDLGVQVLSTALSDGNLKEESKFLTQFLLPKMKSEIEAARTNFPAGPYGS